MRILHTISYKVPPEAYGKEGSSKVALDLLTYRKGLWKYGVMSLASTEVQEVADATHFREVAPRFIGKTMYEDLRSLAGQYDVVHLHVINHNFIGYVVKLCEEFPSVKFIFTHHTPPDINMDVSFRYRSVFVDSFKLKNLKHVVLSPSHLHRLRKILPESAGAPIRVIPNGVPVVDRVNVERDLDVIIVARFDMSKNVLDSIDLSLGATGGKVGYVGGTSRISCSKMKGWQEYLMRYAEIKENFRDRFIEFGEVDNEIVRTQLIPRAKVLVTMSRIETFGIPIVEAAMQGVPSIVADTGGTADIVRDLGVGKIVHYTKTTRITRQKEFGYYIGSMMNLEEPTRARLRIAAMQNYSIDNTIRLYEDLYEQP